MENQKTAPSWSPRLAWVAALLGLTVMAVAMFARGLWRDEYWSIYNSDPDVPLNVLFVQRMGVDVHPPFYFTVLHFWRLVSESGEWARAFNFPTLILGLAAAWALGRKRPGETGAFLFMCVTSFWLMYYGVEARMYFLAFVLCALSVLIAGRYLEQGRRPLDIFLFGIVAMAAALTHYFSALWVATLGFWMGVTELRARRFGAFLAWGAASVIAVAPAAAWIAFFRPDDTAAAGPHSVLSMRLFADGLTQFLRGLVVKTMAANIAATIAAILCAGALMRRRAPFDAVLAAAVITTVVAAFVIHLALTPLIKERAFIVIVPALLMLAVRAMAAVEERQTKARRLIAWVPIVALAAPLLFSSELFKDREKWGQVRKLINEGGACAGAPIAAYYRPSGGFPIAEYNTKHILAGAAGGRDVVFVDVTNPGSIAPKNTQCRVKAVALQLPRGEREEHDKVRAAFRSAGLDLDHLEERNIGGGRQLVYIAPAH